MDTLRTRPNPYSAAKVDPSDIHYSAYSGYLKDGQSRVFNGSDFHEGREFNRKPFQIPFADDPGRQALVEAFWHKLIDDQWGINDWILLHYETARQGCAYRAVCLYWMDWHYGKKDLESNKESEPYLSLVLLLSVSSQCHVFPPQVHDSRQELHGA